MFLLGVSEAFRCQTGVAENLLTCSWIMSFFYITVLTLIKHPGVSRLLEAQSWNIWRRRSDLLAVSQDLLGCLGIFSAVWICRGGFQLEVMLVWNVGSQHPGCSCESCENETRKRNVFKLQLGGEVTFRNEKKSSVTEQVILRSRTFQNIPEHSRTRCLWNILKVDWSVWDDVLQVLT